MATLGLTPQRWLRFGNGVGECHRAGREALRRSRSLVKSVTQRTPRAISIAKKSINASTEHQRGIGALGMPTVALCYETDESNEGGNAKSASRAVSIRTTDARSVVRGHRTSAPSRYRPTSSVRQASVSACGVLARATFENCQAPPFH